MQTALHSDPAPLARLFHYVEMIGSSPHICVASEIYGSTNVTRVESSLSLRCKSLWFTVSVVKGRPIVSSIHIVEIHVQSNVFLLHPLLYTGSCCKLDLHIWTIHKVNHSWSIYGLTNCLKSRRDLFIHLHDAEVRLPVIKCEHSL